VHLKPKSTLTTEPAQDQALAAIFDSATGKRLTAKERKARHPTLAAIGTADESVAEPKRTTRQKGKRSAGKRKKRSTEADLPASSLGAIGRGT
jgi:hypothetical protein